MERQNTNDMEILSQKIVALKEQVKKMSAEFKTHAEKRDNFNNQFRKLSQEISGLKNERNSLNEEVKTLKQQRDEAQTKIRTIFEEIRTNRQKITELKKETPKKSRQQLQKELEDIEWEIQTTSLDLQEEKQLIEHVRQLEMQLNVCKKIELRDKKLAELRKEIGALETKEAAFHQELTEKAQESREIHSKMLAKITESKNVKGEADNMHCAYVQAKEKARTLNAERERLMEQKEKLHEAIRVEDGKKRKTAEQTLREKLSSQAKDKLQRGEKLSWEEFQLLAEDDAQTQG